MLTTTTSGMGNRLWRIKVTQLERGNPSLGRVINHRNQHCIVVNEGREREGSRKRAKKEDEGQKGGRGGGGRVR